MVSVAKNRDHMMYIALGLSGNRSVYRRPGHRTRDLLSYYNAFPEARNIIHVRNLVPEQTLSNYRLQQA